MKKSTKNYGIIDLQLFAEEGGDAPQTNTTDTQTPSFDYEKEYKKQAMEIERLKNAISKTNSENAEYKRKELEKMSAEEKQAQELQELMDSKTKIEAELQEMKLEKEIYAKGFTDDECEKLKKSGISVEAVSCFADILKARIEENTKNVKATLIKDTTPTEKLGGGSTTSASPISDFAKFQKEQSAKSHPKKVEL